VAENVVAIDKKFWLRVATRNDTAQTPEQKERLQVCGGAIELDFSLETYLHASRTSYALRLLLQKLACVT